MEPRGEGQSRGDDPSRADVFSRAIIAEKDPFARGYMENLRAQIAAIAARHGANARDVWDRAVQDRMSVDEMVAVNDLFARIKAMSERKMSRAEERRILESLDEREAAAREILDEAIEECMYGPPDIFLEMFMRADLYIEAQRFLEKFQRKFSEPDISIAVRFTTRVAVLERATDPVLSDIIFGNLFATIRDATGGMLEKDRHFLSAYDAFVRTRSNDELAEMAEEMPATPRDWDFVAVERLALELQRRGIDGHSDALNAVRRHNDEEYLDEEMRPYDFSGRILQHIALAEMERQQGIDPVPTLNEAIRLLVAARGDADLADDNYIIDMPKTLVSSIVAMGLDDFLKEMVNAEPFTEIDWSDRWVLRGCIDGKRFDKAEEILKSYGDTRGIPWEISDLIHAFIDAGEVDRAERIYATYNPIVGESVERIAFARLADRARRGEDILAEAKAWALRENGDAEGYRRLPIDILANAAIATIGYTVGMRNRIAEYAAKR